MCSHGFFNGKRSFFTFFVCISFIVLSISACENSGGSQPGERAQILEFEIAELPDLIFSVDQSNGIIEVRNTQYLLQNDFEKTNLTAQFETSKGAKVLVDEVEQVSGETANNFAEGLTYTVISEDETSQRTYFVYLDWDLPVNYLLEGDVSAELNPSGRSPLSALLEFETKEPVSVTLEVLGTMPIRMPIEAEFPSSTKNHSIPVLGLYPDAKNYVVVSLMTEQSRIARDTLTFETEPLPDFFPVPRITEVDSDRKEPGWHFSEVHIGNAGDFNSYPLIFDNSYEIRWYVDLSELGKIAWPVQFNDDNTFYFGNRSNIYEYDLLGNKRKQITIDGYYLHHEVIKLPNGNYVAAVTKGGTTMIKNGEEMSSVEDYIIEVDPAGNVVTEWDMAEVLDVNRTDLSDGGDDWFHMNAIWYDESDNSLIVSGRNQGVVKVNWENELQWILAPHKGWGKAGRYEKTEETKPYLLTAVDANGQAYSEELQLGDLESDEFSWTWGQHTPMLLPNGNLFVFDNGTNRNFGAGATYSLGTEYEIDEENMTVKEVWSYGRSRGDELFSNIISDVDYLPQTGNRLFMPGIVRTGRQPHAKIVEVTYPEKEVVFEAQLNFKNALVNGQGWGNLDISYRGERVTLYKN